MTERENLFRPIHKGIRSMIYQMGLRLGTTEFRDPEAGNQLAEDLKHDLPAGTSSCFLCLMTAHSQHEEKDLFAPVNAQDPDVVELVMEEHRMLARRVQAVAKSCDELIATSDRVKRGELGDGLYQTVSDFFAASLAHMNNEEALLVPVMWERFSDEQLRGFRAGFYNHLPMPRFEEWMRWTLPALNPHELAVLLAGMKTDPPPNRFSDALRIARATLSPDRWAVVQAQVMD